MPHACRRLGWFTILVVLLLGASVEHAQAQQQQLVPPAFELDSAAANAINAAWLTEDERRAMRVFHGVFDARDLATPPLQALAALNAWDFGNPVLSDPAAPLEVRAEALLLAGELEQALALLEGARSNRAARIRAEAYEGLGRMDDANSAVEPVVKNLISRKITDAAELTEGVRAMLVRARVQGQPARDFQTMINLLARAHQELDRLYWPAKLAEAQLLVDKHHVREAVAALYETLSLNPRCAEAWYLLGQVALSLFDFDGASAAVDALRRIHRQHPLASLLEAESHLIQDGPEVAREALAPVLKRFPAMRPALALNCAAEALFYDAASLRTQLDRFDELSPGSAQAWYIVGRHLAMNRQYEIAADALEEAMRRQPSWPAPQIELGLMELQSGRDDRALTALRRVAKLDPFDKRAANSLFLLEELSTYARIETEHFIVRYKPGIDEVVAEMMPTELERIHEIVSRRFDHQPPQKTVIELTPDHERFSVRVTGMPFVETVAACTGPVIAMEVPREGVPSKHLGLFDWPRVIQHEYTHTITLGQTRNRIPHWLTEAAAVSMEPGPRKYDTCLQLADAYREKRLFNLDEIKWAFVRPKRPGDRGLAYAQGHWMVEYMNERFGQSALVQLLGHYFQGEREQQAIPNALGISRERFYADFLEWAAAQIKLWGLAAEPTIEQLTDELRAGNENMALVMAASQQARLDVIVKRLTSDIGEPSMGRHDRALRGDQWPPLVRPKVELTDDLLAQWREKYPDHPDLLEVHIRRRLARTSDAEAAQDPSVIDLLQQYAKLRPVDPFPHKKLAQIRLDRNEPALAIEHFEFLDVREEKTPVYAQKLAELYRGEGKLDRALAKALRAVHINPYSAQYRELVAAIALQAKSFQVARQHIVALTKLEPDRPQHKRRLEALDKMIKG